MNESEQTVQTESPKTRAPRLSAEKALPQSGADTLVRIIKGYAVASDGGQTQINYKDVASAAGLGPTVVSKNNRFLLESEILTSPKFGYYVPSEAAVRFARESAWDEPAAKAHLRKAVLNSWYGQVAVQNFTLRPVLKRDDLKRALAIKCGATEGDSNALEFLTDFLIYTGIVIQNEDGSLAKGDLSGEEGPMISHDRDVSPVGVQARAVSGLTNTSGTAGDKSITLTVHIHVRSADDLTPEYANRVKEWLRLLESDTITKDISITAADHQDLALAG